MTTKAINWTTDDRMMQLLATGVEKLESGDDRTGRTYFGAMRNGIAFRSLKLREAQAGRGKAKRK